MKVIIVTGSVCSGKSTLAKKLAKKKNTKYIDVNKIISKNRSVVKGYDRKRKCKIIDIQKLNKVLIEIIRKSKQDLVIDSHFSHYLPKKYIDLCIVTKCDLKILKKRLEKRGYHKEKIRENLDAEIFDVCLNEAREMGHKIKIVKTN